MPLYSSKALKCMCTESTCSFLSCIPKTSQALGNKCCGWPQNSVPPNPPWGQTEPAAAQSPLLPFPQRGHSREFPLFRNAHPVSQSASLLLQHLLFWKTYKPAFCFNNLTRQQRVLISLVRLNDGRITAICRCSNILKGNKLENTCFSRTLT